MSPEEVNDDSRNVSRQTYFACFHAQLKIVYIQIIYINLYMYSLILWHKLFTIFDLIMEYILYFFNLMWYSLSWYNSQKSCKHSFFVAIGMEFYQHLGTLGPPLVCTACLLFLFFVPSLIGRLSLHIKNCWYKSMFHAKYTVVMMPSCEWSNWYTKDRVIAHILPNSQMCFLDYDFKKVFH